MQNKFIESIANTVLLLLFFMAAVSYNGKLFGKKAEELFVSKADRTKVLPPTNDQMNALGIEGSQFHEESLGVWTNPEKGYVINTMAFSKGIYGFGGQIPMLLHVDSGKIIQDILLLENNETPDFIASAQEKGIISQWIGKSYNEITSLKPDILSGATMTSNAINRSIQNSIQSLYNGNISTNWISVFDIKTIAALLVIILGVIVSFIGKGKKNWRTIQLILNTTVLGIWCGKFISLNVLMGWTANGMNLLTSGIVFLMLVLSVVMPLFFQKQSFYCNWLCPFGSAQELAGKLSKKKYQPGKSLMKVLKHTQTFITLALFLALWMGIASDIVNYEPFSAFIFKHASTAVLTIAALSLLTAVITPRPWCRFACPTGQILNWTNKM
jgi:Na+-translocating ferredoxin:NAD+ oxidoreductase RnfG subunit